MKLTLASPADLAGITSRIARLVGRPSVPVLAGALLTATAEQITVTGYDHDTLLTRHLAGDTVQSGQALISARLLADVAKALPTQAVTIAADEQQATVTCGTVTTRLPLLPLEDYPELPDWPDTVVRLEAEPLSAALAATGHARADESDTLLCGVHLHVEDEQLVVATASHTRFAQARVPTLSAGTSCRLRTDHTVLAEAAKQARGELHLAAGERTVGLVTDTERVLARQYAAVGEPPLHKARERVRGEPALVETGELSAAMRRCRLFGETVTAVLTAEHDTLSILTAGGDTGGSEEGLPIDYTGPNTVVGVGPANLDAAVRALGTEHAEMIVPDAPDRAIQLTPVQTDGSHGSQVQIVAPKKVPA